MSSNNNISQKNKGSGDDIKSLSSSLRYDEPSPTITHISAMSGSITNTLNEQDEEFKDAVEEQDQLQASTTNEKVQQEEKADNFVVEDASNYGKMKAIFSIMTKFIGVKDMVGLRISLPSQLLDPISNLEFWNYMDCPDLFTAIKTGDSATVNGADLPLKGDSELDRMLRVVRWWFSKDVKFIITDKLSKPYNSILGEQFICWYDIPQEQGQTSSDNQKDESVLMDKLTLSSNSNVNQVWSITEQISHHPPVSAYYHYCPQLNMIARGVDQIQAKFTGTSVRVQAGHLNKGIFVDLIPADENDVLKQSEEYILSHPHAFVNGWLKFNLWISVNGYSVVICPISKLCCLIEYKDEPFFGKPKFAIEAKIFKYDSDQYKTTEEVINYYSGKKRIPDEDLLCILTGSWKDKIFYQYTQNSGRSDLARHTLIDLSLLKPAKSATTEIEKVQGSNIVKQTRDLSQQESFESRKLWEQVSTNIIKGNFNEATKLKRDLEDKQRQDGKDRKLSGKFYESFWFGFLDNELKNIVGEHDSKEKHLAVGGSSLPLHIEKDDSVIKSNLQGKPFLVKKNLDEGLVPWIRYISQNRQ